MVMFAKCFTICFLIRWTVLADSLFDYNLSVARISALNISDVFEYLCRATPAEFGFTRDEDDVAGCVIAVHPPDACTIPLLPDLTHNETMSLWGICKPIALVIRGNCTFASKVENAQEAGYQGVIVYDNGPGDGVRMTGNGTDNDIKIPSFFVSQSCGETLLANYTLKNKYAVIISKYTDYGDIFKYLIPFVAVVGLCFLITLIALIIKIARDRRKELRKRLSRRKLKKIPTKKYKKNDTPETCPICLDDFVDGEKLRVLPCNHWYHLKCVDPWLTKNRKVCPVCKRKVLPSDSDSSDSENGNEERRSNSERRPLLSPTSPETYGSIASYPDQNGDDDSAGQLLSPSSSSEPNSPVINRDTPIVLGFTSVRSRSYENLPPSTSNCAPSRTSQTLDGIQNHAYEPVGDGDSDDDDDNDEASKAYLNSPKTDSKVHGEEQVNVLTVSDDNNLLNNVHTTSGGDVTTNRREHIV